MKTITTLVLLTVVILASCSKDRTCHCRIAYGDSVVTATYLIDKATESRAVEVCDLYERQQNGVIPNAKTTCGL